jgi:hypothetical protein
MNKAVVLVPDAVCQAFTKALSDDTRLLLLDINMDSLEFQLLQVEAIKGSDEEDFESVGKYFKEQPVLACFKYKSKWILIAWMPEDSKVQKKVGYY